ncbi:SAM-dependent methyltransferase [Caulobacter henricii]|uniref:tRNA-Thr(GGU) m(6)t(6)A37 methyltransferase TsaA n=1 Tax=Caulobacter henricii TaxID=69395 RepID=A0A0P0NX09_9CAUL|nr:SAM-dependent methyltransferase [Caulobacter henricii]ALL12558.1 tRNA-Thr(GGU) m(6)t(6)A37 methyltransferase TsaA [Caulobacter henricii]
MVDQINLVPIAHVRGGRAEVIDDDWGGSRATLELDPDRFSAEALAGLEDFSHIEVIFVFDRVPDDKIEFGARRPRGRPDWPLVGIFAQRGKNRPNRLGLCTCRLISVKGLSVEVEGLDAVDGTPVLDIKPAMQGFLPREPLRQPPWAAEIMAGYW